ncbi:hypothetical protein PYCC9005_003649 [Savitreella phatthalungensis]
MSAAAAAPTTAEATRKLDTSAIPATANNADPSELLEQRFKAWRSLVSDLESYFKHVEKIHDSNSKDWARVAKTIDVPFQKDQQTFEGSGVRDIFSQLQGHATKLSNDHQTFGNQVDSTLVKGAKRLDGEIKDFVKRLDKDGVKGSKSVSKLQSDTEKHITLLGTHIAKSSGPASSIKASEDPYITHRGVLHRLHNQVTEENDHTDTLLALQKECADFEAQIVQSIQNLVSQLGSQASAEATNLQNSHNSLSQNTSTVTPTAVWGTFAQKGGLLDAHAPKRSANSLVFAGKDDKATVPVIEGDLFRKGTVIKKYNAGYYVLTPSGFLHEFKSKSHESDPEPEWSIDVSTCALGAHSSPQSQKNKFILSGKTKGLISSKHDFAFQATSYEELVRWWTAIKKFAASSPNVEETAPGDESDSELASPTTPAQQQQQHQAIPAAATTTSTVPATHETTAVPATATTHTVPATAATTHTTAATTTSGVAPDGTPYPTVGAHNPVV